jgi:hypothetical protein
MDRHIREDEEIRSEIAADIDLQAKHDPYREEMEVEAPDELWDGVDAQGRPTKPDYDSRAGS